MHRRSRHPGLGRCCDCLCIQEHLHPREFVLLVIAFFGCLAILLGALSYVTDDAAARLKTWANKNWTRTECQVKDAGVSYTGDCVNESDSVVKAVRKIPNYDYRDCQAEVEPACRDALHAAFGASLTAMRRLGDDSAPRAEASQVAPRDGGAGRFAALAAPRRRLEPKHLGELCYNEFVAWAEVELEGVRECGYRTGIITDSADRQWGMAMASFGRITKARGGMPCWHLTVRTAGLLRMHSCRVIALEDPEDWPMPFDVPRWLQPALLLGAGICALLAGVAAMVHQRCWSMGVDNWADLGKVFCMAPSRTKPRRAATASLPPGADDAESDAERAAAVRGRWWAFRASVLSEYELLGSAREYAPTGASEGAPWHSVGFAGYGDA